MDADGRPVGAENPVESPMVQTALEEDIPDPDEGDLDDLDGKLRGDEFSASLTQS